MYHVDEHELLYKRETHMNNTQALKKRLLPNVYLKRSANRHPYYIKLLYFCSAAEVLALKCNKTTSMVS